MTRYNAENERIKRQYFDYQKEAMRKSETTIHGIAGALQRFEVYTGHKGFGSFTKEQAMGFRFRRRWVGAGLLVECCAGAETNEGSLCPCRPWLLPSALASQNAREGRRATLPHAGGVQGVEPEYRP